MSEQQRTLGMACRSATFALPLAVTSLVVFCSGGPGFLPDRVSLRTQRYGRPIVTRETRSRVARGPVRWRLFDRLGIAERSALRCSPS
jgi:hypothetical protein